MTHPLTTVATTLDLLCAKALKLTRADEYFPGRAHFAGLLGARLESAVETLRHVPYADRPATRNGLATALGRAVSMAVLADDACALARRRETCFRVMGLAAADGTARTGEAARVAPAY